MGCHIGNITAKFPTANSGKCSQPRFLEIVLRVWLDLCAVGCEWVAWEERKDYRFFFAFFFRFVYAGFATMEVAQWTFNKN
jgi:hypothetical protein